jgi:dienelactone hydrolase
VKIPQLLCLALYLLIAPQAQADELVHFDSATVKPSPFLERKAKENGAPLPAPEATPLIGYLSRPDGNGPFPAVVLMHGCGGIHAHVKEVWPQRLVSWGYAVLVVDSYATRNIKSNCTSYLPYRVFDAYGGLDFLSKTGFVDASRVALMGFSAGGIATLEATKVEGNAQLMDEKFKAAIGYYPVCAPHEGDATVPTLILNGELDDWSPAERCRRRIANLSGKGPPVELHVYPGARHDFDDEAMVKPKTILGHVEEYNADAAAQSIASVKDFLQTYIGK